MAKSIRVKSTDARHYGGAVRSSDETSVMEVERRGSVRWFELNYNSKEEDTLNSTKPFMISKQLVMKAYQLVKSNQGAAVLISSLLQTLTSTIKIIFIRSGTESHREHISPRQLRR